jgi:hypothetical protein
MRRIEWGSDKRCGTNVPVRAPDDHNEFAGMPIEFGDNDMSEEALTADFYRNQAHLCHTLAAAAPAGTPLFARLLTLAKSYEEKARTAESNLGGNRRSKERGR